MISRRTLLLAPLAAYAPLPEFTPVAGYERFKLSIMDILGPPDLVFGVHDNVSMCGALASMKSICNWAAIYPDNEGRKLLLYFFDDGLMLKEASNQLLTFEKLKARLRHAE